MSVFQKPQLNRFPRLAEGREVAREKVTSKTSAAGRKAFTDAPNALETLKKNIDKKQRAKFEHSYVWLDLSDGLQDSVLTCLRLEPRSSTLRSMALVQNVLLPKAARETSCYLQREAPWPAPLAGPRPLVQL